MQVAEAVATRAIKACREKSERFAVGIGSVTGAMVLVIILIMAILAREYFPLVGWAVIPVVVMSIALDWVASKNKE